MNGARCEGRDRANVGRFGWRPLFRQYVGALRSRNLLRLHGGLQPALGVDDQSGGDHEHRERQRWRHRLLTRLELASRRVFLAGYTEEPTAAWVTQQARNLSWELGQANLRPKLLIHDRDTKFAAGFDEVFRSEGVRVATTPYRAPRANAVCEGWIGSARREALDWLLIAGERHLWQVLSEYVEHYNVARPHRSLGLRAPMARRTPASQLARLSVDLV